MFEMHFCEYNRSNRDQDVIYRPSGSGDTLLLLWKTPMQVWLGGKLLLAQENAMICYTPGVCQHYQAVGRFRNSYLHFSCSDDLPGRYGIPKNQIFYPDSVEETDTLIHRMQREYLAREPFAEDLLELLTRQLFAALGRRLAQPRTIPRTDDPFFLALSELRLQMLAHCEEDWNTRRLCRLLNIEKTQLYDCYRRFFDTTPKAELLQVRLERARHLLTNEALQIQQIAEQCGFSSAEHFTRYYKKYCGCSPRAWRQQRMESRSQMLDNTSLL